ncbi:MAG: hypothetical protein RR320_01555 [Oscillospiraceae bacterium]
MTFTQMSKLFEDFFTIAPPLDSPGKAGTEPDRFQGDRVLLGNGISAAGGKGLDKIQVLERTSKGEYAPVSMKTWLDGQRKMKKSTPEKIAKNLEEAIHSHRVIYYELGREYPTNLVMDDKNNLRGVGLAGAADGALRSPKPKLTFGQAFKKFFTRDWHATPDGKAFDERMLMYNRSKYIADTSIVRQGGATISQNYIPDMKGKILASSPDEITAVDANYQRRKDIRAQKGNVGLANELRVAARQAADRRAWRAEGKGWTVVETPPAQQEAPKEEWTVVESPLERQAKLKSMQDLKKSIATNDPSPQASEKFFEKVSETLVEAMNLKDGPDGQSRAKQLRSSEVFQELLHGKGETPAARQNLQGTIQKDNLIDQFAKIAMQSKSPLNMFHLAGQEYKGMITSLADHCKTPPTRLQKMASEVLQEKAGQKKEQPSKKAEEKTQPVKAEKASAKDKGMGGK